MKYINNETTQGTKKTAKRNRDLGDRDRGGEEYDLCDNINANRLHTCITILHKNHEREDNTYPTAIKLILSSLWHN